MSHYDIGRGYAIARQSRNPMGFADQFQKYMDDLDRPFNYSEELPEAYNSFQLNGTIRRWRENDMVYLKFAGFIMAATFIRYKFVDGDEVCVIKECGGTAEILVKAKLLCKRAA